MPGNFCPIITRIPGDLTRGIDLDGHHLGQTTTLDGDHSGTNTTASPASFVSSLNVGGNVCIGSGDICPRNDVGSLESEAKLRIAHVSKCEDPSI